MTWEMIKKKKLWWEKRDKFRGYYNVSEKWLWRGVWFQYKKMLKSQRMIRAMFLNMQEGVRIHMIFARDMNILSIIKGEKIRVYIGR